MAKVKQTEIISRKVSYKNRFGKMLAAFIDERHSSQKDPWIIICPGYAETKKDYISLSYYLVVNGFRVLRYDASCHLGESEGDIVNADLLKMMADLRASIDYLEHTVNCNQIGLVCVSISGRVGIRLAREDTRVSFLCLLVGLIDLRETFKRIYREDIIGTFDAGGDKRTIDIFGHEVSTEFISNAISSNMHDLQGSIEDVQALDIPLIFIAASNDAWINEKDVRTLIGRSRHQKSRAIFIDGALHQLQENPFLARKAIVEVVLACKSQSRTHYYKNDEIIAPNIHEIVRENKREKDDLRRLSAITKIEEQEFWKNYLPQFSIVLKIDDYRELLEIIDGHLGSILNGDRIADIGCGNGNFLIWLISEGMRKYNAELVTYIGIDFVHQALLEARLKQREELDQNLKYKRNWMFEYAVGDLDQGIPLSSNTIDKACCNLVVSYVNDDKVILSELYRIVKNDGRVVISSLKPYCDLSLIYSDFADQATGKKDLNDAVALLSNTGKIRRKESEGHYRFYSEDELTTLLHEAGFRKVQILRSCGNQVNVGLGIK